MTEDPTKDLDDGEMLSLTMPPEIGTGSTKLEAQAEDRSRETRTRLDLIIRGFDKRLTELERRQNYPKR